MGGFQHAFLSAGCKHFDRARTTAYTDGMEVKLSPELQAKLDSIAARQGRDSASTDGKCSSTTKSPLEWKSSSPKNNAAANASPLDHRGRERPGKHCRLRL